MEEWPKGKSEGGAGIQPHSADIEKSTVTDAASLMYCL
jgi:hypothetical protein